MAYKLQVILAARMMQTMQTLQALPRYMCVNLRGRDIRVAKQHLHYAQIGAVIE